MATELPYDIAFRIASSLPVRDACALGSCSRFWRELCVSDPVWISLYRRRWPEIDGGGRSSDSNLSLTMAFCNKLGGLLNGQLSVASRLNSARWMSSSKLSVAGLSWNTDGQTLREAFDRFGDVTEARIIMDRNTGKSRGFGFVGFTETEAASSAMSAMDGQELDGRSVSVRYATERPSGPRTGGGGGYGGGGGGYGDSY